MSTTQELYQSYVAPTYSRSLELVRGKGAYVWAEDGTRYLDFGGGIAVNCLGHAPEAITKALTQQSSELIHVSNLYYHRWQGELARRLVEKIAPGKIFFCNSGAEANEALYKLARRKGEDQGRFEIITTTNSFHGRTLAGIAATGQEKIKKGFGPLMPGFKHVPYNDVDAMRQAVGPQTAGILIEGIQGEGGITPATPEYLLGLRKLCDEKGILLMMDCVQCGHYRTGKFQSYQKILEGVAGGENFQPDALSMAKSIGGGFPMGAVWISAPHADVLQPGMHGTTYGGTPLACSVALAVLDAIEKDQLNINIEKQGEKLRQSLKPLIGTTPLQEIRGFGGILGLVMNQPAAEVCGWLRQEGLLTVPAGTNVVRLLPPLNVTPNEVQEAASIITQTLKSHGK